MQRLMLYVGHKDDALQAHKPLVLNNSNQGIPQRYPFHIWEKLESVEYPFMKKITQLQ